MRYLCVSWKHDLSEDPIELYSELDDGSWEVRKVEVFADGRIGYACRDDNSESTRLGLAPVPPQEEIASDPQFTMKEVSAKEFERLWETARAARVYG